MVEESFHRVNFSTAPVPAEFARRLERERDEWAAMCGRYKQELDEAREQIAKLCDIAEKAINFGWYRAPYLGYPGPAWGTLHAELDRINKEGAK